MLDLVSQAQRGVFGPLTSHAVIPNYNGIRPPSDSGLEVLRQGNMVIQELEEIIALFLLEADNVSSELRVDIQGLFASRWVSSDNGMDRSARGSALRIVSGW